MTSAMNNCITTILAMEYVDEACLWALHFVYHLALYLVYHLALYLVYHLKLHFTNGIFDLILLLNCNCFFVWRHVHDHNIPMILNMRIWSNVHDLNMSTTLTTFISHHLYKWWLILLRIFINWIYKFNFYNSNNNHHCVFY